MVLALPNMVRNQAQIHITLIVEQGYNRTVKPELTLILIRRISIAITPSFITDWIKHLQGLYGTAANGKYRL